MNETQISQGSVSFQEAININGDIQFDNVNFAYPARSDVLVLRNLTLTARAGETTALVGSSGSGKSTCVSLLLRFYEPLSGCIIINGRSITDCNFKPLRQNIGVVSQEPVLFATSIYENIRFGKENATRAEIEEAARQANAHNFIMQLPNKYGTIVGERGVQLSGGEKQRVALARALVKRPALLLLDEATSALDNTNEMVVQKALDQACKGRTTVVIAHRLSAVQNAHRIYVLDNGCVIEQGTHEALMSQEGSRYCEMMKAQESEKAENDIDEKTSTAPIEDDDQKQISGHSLHPSHSEFDDDNKAFGACTYEERKHQILKFSLLFLLMGIVLLAIRFIQYTAFAISGSKLVERIRIKAFAHYLRQEMSFFDHLENSSGAICNRLSSDGLAVQQMVGSYLGIVCESVATFGVGLVIGFFFSWQLALTVLFYIVILFVVAFMQIRRQARLNKRCDYVFGLASSFAVEIIHNMRTVKQLTSETEFLRQFSDLVLQEFRTRQLSDSLSAARSFFNLFNRTSAIDNSSINGLQLSDFKGAIEFDQVKFAYPCRPTSYILNKLHLTIKPGQRVALVGISGCGKSTVIQLLERFYDPMQGRICLDGVDIRQLNIQWLRSSLGLVSQEPILFNLTIAQNIAYGKENASIGDIIEAATKANIHHFIQQLSQGYETRVGMKGSHLSGGEKQRIAIARVLLRRPKILLLDEATSAMDFYNEQAVQEALEKAETENPTCTSLIIAHHTLPEIRMYMELMYPNWNELTQNTCESSYLT
ncbi:unnamed protein product [Rotaria sordida]|uniref:Uncharacterized protein n=1 Tax=Rotaria sordida TaxID=392033 RepID=A0A815UEI4_9BILA|nr:unnamed protein product [Rotaria sordida]